MRLLAAEALAVGLKKLIKLAEDDKGRIVRDTGSDQSINFVYDDLEAAKALVQAALKLRSGSTKASSEVPGDKDLFDRPPSNWTFTKK